MKWKVKAYIEKNYRLFSELDFLSDYYYKPLAVSVLLYYLLPGIFKAEKEASLFCWRTLEIDKYIEPINPGKTKKLPEISKNLPFIEFFLSKISPVKLSYSFLSANNVMVVSIRSPYGDSKASRPIGYDYEMD